MIIAATVVVLRLVVLDGVEIDVAPTRSPVCMLRAKTLPTMAAISPKASLA
jgi:hypothetical protein